MTSASCRSCGGGPLEPVLDLGPMPLADRLLTEAMLAEDEPKFPLSLVFCPHCALTQIDYTVPPEELFCRDYPYFSSFSPRLLAHSRENALELIETRGLNADSFVVEIASNDGYLLRNFVERGVPVLGVDPAEGPAKAAQAIGVPTICDFFRPELAERIRREHQPAQVILGNNVLAHVPDPNQLAAAVKLLLAPDGIASIEVPYVRDLVDHCEFDTIYHEHFCYFSLTALTALFGRHRLHINDVRRLDIHGGSLRLYIGHDDRPSEAVTKMRRDEREAGLDRRQYFLNFGERVLALKSVLLERLASLQADGKRIAGYGAAAKGCIMLNYLGVGPEMLSYVVDRNFHKHGKYMPGQHVKILPAEQLVADRPDYVLILAWNFADEIVAQQAEYRRLGGKFIVPVPTPRVV